MLSLKLVSWAHVCLHKDDAGSTSMVSSDTVRLEPRSLFRFASLRTGHTLKIDPGFSGNQDPGMNPMR